LIDFLPLNASEGRRRVEFCIKICSAAVTAATAPATQFNCMKDNLHRRWTCPNVPVSAAVATRDYVTGNKQKKKKSFSLPLHCHNIYLCTVPINVRIGQIRESRNHTKAILATGLLLCYSLKE
jgi:hypothetical protein